MLCVILQSAAKLMRAIATIGDDTIFMCKWILIVTTVFHKISKGDLHLDLVSAPLLLFRCTFFIETNKQTFLSIFFSGKFISPGR